MITSDTKTVVGLFDDINDARNAVRELIDAGYTRADVDLLSHASAEEYSRYFDADGRYRTEPDETVVVVDDVADAEEGASVGAGLGALAGLVIGLTLLTIPGVGPVLVAGPLAGTLLGTGIGGVIGGLVGSLSDTGVPEEEVHVYAEGLRRGGTLVIVRATGATAGGAASIINRNRPVDTIQRSGQWREHGWKQFDAAANPYTTQQIVQERQFLATSGTPTRVV